MKLKLWQSAIIILAVIAAGFWWLKPVAPVYENYNQHEDACFAERLGGAQNMKNAESEFNGENYKKAIYSFESIEDLTNPELQYFYAIALIETNHYRNAELYLENLRAGTSIYKDKAIWWQALSRLKRKKNEESLIFLKQVKPDTDDYERAQKLIQDLQKNLKSAP